MTNSIYRLITDRLRTAFYPRALSIMVADQKPTPGHINHVFTPDAGDIIIDIRHPHEARSQPLMSSENKVLEIPFFKLAEESSNLNKSQRYLIYCDRGIMSRLQALTLKDRGFTKISVLVKNKAP
ncbi:hypothetical protein N9L75_02105 [Porticoccaceae bacterium]|nr:hypothetical protein [Porticoccaceae bacterium]MDA8681358.1 hypothetical protein [Porticoccaceae bacterium]MDA8788574.1 hypothetical protein [Porticoccaceae bacterium]MDB2344416.1 hypothetical protein [Porticoccaceae bacterium]MDB2486693.1 hypothetical protein [Porticoccaceae bacterium]